MARNKHPEETVSRILEAAFRLFLEKGYEHTSIQDIIDQLGGLSKGAIYHHFKSKEEILEAVSDYMAAESNQLLLRIRDDGELNGKEKLQAIFKNSLQRPVQESFFTFAPNLHKNPKLLSSILQDTIENVAPNYILPIIRQGMADGSIRTEYPQALSELLVLTANIWINPMIFDSDEKESYEKFMVFDQMLRGMGLDLIDQEMIDRLTELTALYQKNR